MEELRKTIKSSVKVVGFPVKYRSEKFRSKIQTAALK
jgi:hypothetical protein